ncbi:MAG: hypothetical protein ABUS79_01425 [Pseudomonadota bacterium]
MTKPERARRRRREDERAARKTVRETERLAARLPGGDPERPIEVASAAVIEVQARATPCAQCGGTLSVQGDRASSTARGVLRQMDMVCRRCHTPRILWFRVTPALPS